MDSFLEEKKTKEEVTKYINEYEPKIQKIRTYVKRCKKSYYGYHSLQEATVLFQEEMMSSSHAQEEKQKPVLDNIVPQILSMLAYSVEVMKIKNIRNKLTENDRKEMQRTKSIYRLLSTYLGIVEAFPEIKVPEKYGKRYYPRKQTEPLFPSEWPDQEGYFEEYYQKNYSNTIFYLKGFIQRIKEEKKLTGRAIIQLRNNFIKEYLS